MQIKKHLTGGSLRRVMVAEIKAVMSEVAKTEEIFSRVIDKSATELGITPRTLRVWLGPVDAGGWDELQPTRADLEKLIVTLQKKAKKARKSKKTSQAAEVRA